MSSTFGSEPASIFSHDSSPSSVTSCKSSTVPGKLPHGAGSPHAPATISVNTIEKKKIVLPPTLPPPKYKAVSPEVIAAIDEELAGVPVLFITQKLRDIGPKMMATLKRTTASPPPGLPRELEVTIAPDPDPNPSFTDLDTHPTHLLAVYTRSEIPLSPSGQVPRRKVTLFPTHAIMLAAHCAHLPQLPYSDIRRKKRSAQQPENDEHQNGEQNDLDEQKEGPPLPSGERLQSRPRELSQDVAEAQTDTQQERQERQSLPTRLVLPVVPLCIPTPPMFAPLQAYLYTNRADHLLGALLPSPQSQKSGGTVPEPSTSNSSSTPNTLSNPEPSTSNSSSTPNTLSSQNPMPPSSPHSAPSFQISSASRLASQLASSHSTNMLTMSAIRTHGLWANACALGVFDERLWLVIGFAWRVLLAALEQRQASETGQINKVRCRSGDPEDQSQRTTEHEKISTCDRQFADVRQIENERAGAEGKSRGEQ